MSWFRLDGQINAGQKQPDSPTSNCDTWIVKRQQTVVK